MIILFAFFIISIKINNKWTSIDERGLKMKRLIVVVLAVVFSINLAGCGKKSSKEAASEAMSIEQLSTMSAESKEKTDAAVNNPSQAAMPAAKDTVAPEVNLASLPPSGPYKPSIKDVQTALKNAGSYTGKVDGKSGPLTKKAVESFQKTNNLKADGKVGPKTWDALSKYLSSEPSIEQAETIVKKDQS